MAPLSNPRWLHRFAVLTAAATLVLLGAGGLVTSHGVGMAVRDWPNTYGYNLFFFPVSKWVGGVFYEHTHRLIAAGVGLLTGILALWLYGKSARPFMRWAGLALVIPGIAMALLLPQRWADGIVSGTTGLALLGASFVWPRCEPAAKWLRRLGLAAFFLVVLQGVLGGLRVVLLKDQIGILHATVAQLFFVLVCAIALFSSKWWQELSAGEPGGVVPAVRHPDARQRVPTRFGTVEGSGPATQTRRLNLRRLFIGTTALILFQLILGATMRHQHAGLAIPDFPLAYGKLWPATDPESVARYNQQRMEITAANPITVFQIELQMVHRITAVLILAAVAWCAWRARGSGFSRSGSPEGGTRNVAYRLACFWLVLILAQVGLGAATVLANKAADLATAHVLVGALALATGGILCLISCPSLARAADTASAELSVSKQMCAEEKHCRQDADSTLKAAAARCS